MPSNSLAMREIKPKEDLPETNLDLLRLTDRKLKQLIDAGINSLEDLVRFFPIGYTDYSEPKFAHQLEDGMDCIVIGKVLGRRLGGNNRVSVLTVTIEDEYRQKIQVTWFNQTFVNKSILVGTVYAFCGKAKLDHTGRFPPTISVTRFSSNPETLLGLVPRYRKIKGMADAFLTETIRNAFELVSKDDYLKSEIVTACSLMPEYEALFEMHYPQNMERLKKAQERIHFDVLLPFAYNLMLRAKERTRASIYAMPKFEYIKKIAGGLPYSLTTDQKKTINGIVSNINSLTQLNALVQGDVGCGKTIVALMLLAASAENGYQSCLLAPTEVLAKQHFKDISETLKTVPEVRVELLVGGMKVAEKKAVLRDIKSGEINIVVGTHAVIQKGVDFHTLGLVVIDEQHRFGVLQSEELLRKYNPHIIAMSATPIPRTLSMAIYGENTKVYNIFEKPAGRQQVKTIINDNVKAIYNFMYEQIKLGHQAYIVCPFIEASENEKFEDVESVQDALEEAKSAFAFDPNVKVASVNGKMNKTEIETTIADFASGNTQVLISTTVIEVGVNVPNATVMVIKNAERFGLAQLHQLRGRVGRTSYQSYCVLQTEKHPERCKVLCSTTDGFEIAMEDLKLRGHGSYLGVAQSGYDEAVELMLTRPMLYKKAQEVSSYINQTPALEKEYEYLKINKEGSNP